MQIKKTVRVPAAVSVSLIYPNNIQITGISLTGQNTTNTPFQVQFSVSWENSWRIAGGPANWDAAWVFVKYRLGSGPWQHAYLNPDANHVAPSGSSINTGLLTPGTAFNATTNPGIGAFLFRSTPGNGTFTVTNAQLQWNYGANGLSDNAVVDVQLYGIEQVFIPQGMFAAGDGLTDGQQFGITTINTAVANSSLGGVGALGGTNGGYPVGASAPTSANWPNGFNAFYCMKYEISQQGYADFLNSLTRTQQAARVATAIPAGTTSVTNRYVLSNSVAIDTRNGIRCDATIPASSPVTFYCDFDGDGIPGETTDGKDIACGYLNWNDVLSYLDWTGLRPMTETEFEKAARGPVPPLAGEFAWGNTNITGLTTILSPGLPAETPNSGANTLFGFQFGEIGPVRVGSFAGSGTNRQQAGAGYYGNMELSGNAGELVVTMAIPSNYIGTHGNGSLSAAGIYTNSDWPNDGGSSGAGLRGGHAISTASSLRISDRLNVLATVSFRFPTYGGRGTRTAP
ncbi:MAG: SUMF1/EgtB/PvdO family nonheme iron enzyme [Chitinophagaceae bacterium]|nr:SUMF1/EgtB/PvdO family nonheme iron enzyme [Chitinophagaceae bacterium]